jgi:high-affinity nickel-transport protein
MTELASVLALGFLLGVRHATDSDHVVAVTTILSREATLRRVMQVGALWGLGHGVTVFVVGSAIVLGGLVVPPRLALGLELAVGAMLVLLGGLNLAELRRGGTAEPPAPAPHPHADLPHRLLLRPLGVGLVHGLAGSSAIALLVLTTIHDPAWAAAYLVLFGVGTLLGMVAISLGLALPLRGRIASPRWRRPLTAASGALSLGFGVFLVYQIGFVEGLLRGAAALPH